MQVDQNGLEVLDRDECLALLATATLGRVAVTTGALPQVVPVNFHLEGERILIRTAEGTKLDAALCNAVVAFEADDFDTMYHSGWSVVVTGIARVLPADDETARYAPLVRWAPDGRERTIAISTDIVSGRRIVPGAALGITFHSLSP